MNGQRAAVIAAHDAQPVVRDVQRVGGACHARQVAKRRTRVSVERGQQAATPRAGYKQRLYGVACELQVVNFACQRLDLQLRRPAPGPHAHAAGCVAREDAVASWREARGGALGGVLVEQLRVLRVDVQEHDAAPVGKGERVGPARPEPG